MDRPTFNAFVSMLLSQERYQDNGDGTATDVWHQELLELTRGAERDASATMRELSAKKVEAATMRDKDEKSELATSVRAIRWEPE